MLSNRFIYSNILDSTNWEEEYELQTLSQSYLKNNLKVIKMRKQIKKMLSSAIYKWFLGLWVLYIIFSESLRLWASNQNDDKIFYTFTIIALIIFIFDITLQHFSIWEYKLSLNFLLESLATISILLDIGWIYEQFFQCSYCDDYEEFSVAGSEQTIGQKALRYFLIMRYVRMIRLIYLARFSSILVTLRKQYFYIKNYREQRQLKGYITLSNVNGTNTNGKNEQQEQFKKAPIQYVNPNLKNFDLKHYQELYDNRYVQEEEEEDKFRNLGAEISGNNILRIFIIVLIILCLIPVFNNQSYIDSLSAQETSLGIMTQYFNQYSYSGSVALNLRNTYVSQFKNEQNVNLKQLTVYFYQDQPIQVSQLSSFTEQELVDKYRYIEQIVFAYPQKSSEITQNSVYTVVFFERKKEIQKLAWLNLLMILTAMMILFFISFFVDRDTNKLIVDPFQKMMEKIQQILINPVEASKIAEEERFKLEMILKKDPWRRLQFADQEQYETSLLIKTLQKSGTLLALGFGEAGTEIIIKNLEQDKLNPLIKGKKVICIFGFCDIKYFSELTEILKKDVMKLVNTIAEIVHFEVDKYAGTSNKNLGDAFLLVWKFRDDDVEEVKTYDEYGKPKMDIKLKHYKEESNPITSRCELAVLSYLKIICHIQRSKRLLKYQRNKEIQKVIPNFHIKMNFGLHIGWGIEGAIGSNHKIDASYLSPNVNLASRLESVSKQYGVPLLISGELHELFSQDVQEEFRLIDIVNLKGSKKAMSLFTYDMCLKDLPYKKTFLDEIDTLERHGVITAKIKKRIELDFRKQIKFFHNLTFKQIESVPTKKFLIIDEDLTLIRDRFKKQFFDEWKKGFDNYIKGWWQNAKESFEQTLTMIPGYTDGPSQNLLEYMKEVNFKAPNEWKGVRIILKK